MSIQLLLTLIDEASKSGSITFKEKNYLKKKALEFGINTDLVDRMLSAKNIKLIEAEESEKVIGLELINSELRKTFITYNQNEKYDTIIEYFEEKCTYTVDYVLIDEYLKALLSKKEFQKAYLQSEKLLNNIKYHIKNIYPTLGQIYLNAKKHEKALNVFNI
ncbi:MAG: hypothetical protein ACON4M_03020, partial [Crocinitomicaceae bacterium]